MSQFEIWAGKQSIFLKGSDRYQKTYEQLAQKLERIADETRASKESRLAAAAARKAARQARDRQDEVERQESLRKQPAKKSSEKVAEEMSVPEVAIAVGPRVAPAAVEEGRPQKAELEGNSSAAPQEPAVWKRGGKQCQWRKQNGERCNGCAQKDKDFCHAHARKAGQGAAR